MAYTTVPIGGYDEGESLARQNYLQSLEDSTPSLWDRFTNMYNGPALDQVDADGNTTQGWLNPTVNMVNSIFQGAMSYANFRENRRNNRMTRRAIAENITSARQARDLQMDAHLRRTGQWTGNQGTAPAYRSPYDEMSS